jgi:hypothetical protein
MASFLHAMDCESRGSRGGASQFAFRRPTVNTLHPVSASNRSELSERIWFRRANVPKSPLGPARNGISGRMTVAAPQLLSISVSPANPSIPLGNTQQFTATGTYRWDEFSFVDSRAWALSYCCDDPLRPPVFSESTSLVPLFRLYFHLGMVSAGSAGVFLGRTRARVACSKS